MLHEKSDGIQVDGHVGKWYVVGSAFYRGKQVFEVEHESFGDEAAHLILDENGQLVKDEIWNSFRDLEDSNIALTATGLPEFCFGKLEADGEIVRIVRGEKGYYRIAPQPTLPLIELNASIGVNKAQADAMLVGSMFGWDKPGADPKRYDPDGNPTPPAKRRAREMER